MGYASTLNVLHPVEEDPFHLAPVPFIYHQIEDKGRDQWHDQLIADARRTFSEPILEVPDVRHIHDLGSPPQFDALVWSENQNTPVGVWHNVPTNGFLNVKTDSVKALKELIETRYLNALKRFKILDIQGHEASISESWIQFYKNSDYKVLHNHERYGPPYLIHAWAGAYYIDDGNPASTMPYSGVLSFRIRQTNYHIRPRPGLLVMWPADILHEVHPFYGTKERIVVNFNIHINGS
jgi:hypothetical protein